MKTSSFIYSKWLLSLALLFWQGTSLAQAPAITWQKSLGGSYYDKANSIEQTTDGGYILAGYSYSNDGDVTGNHGAGDVWIVKLDLIGNLSWQKSLGGSDGDAATSIQQTTDGGYIVAGISESIDGDVSGNHGGQDYWIVKLDANGNLTWQKSLGGSSGDYDTSIRQTLDGGYIVAGRSSSFDGEVTGNHGGGDFWIIKLAADGTLLWQKCLGGSYTDGAYAIQQTIDGGYIVAGQSESNDGDVTGNHGGDDFWIVKLDSTGNLSWQKSLGGSNDDEAYSIQQTTDGGYIVAGTSKSINGDITGNHGGDDYWVVKLDASGNLSWQKSFGGSYSDEATSIQQTIDGGYIVAGSSGSNDGDVTGNHGISDYWIVKLDSAGNLVWQKSLGGSSFDWAFSIQQCTDGGYIVAGYTHSNDGDVTENYGIHDVWVVKLGGFGVDREEGISNKEISLYPNPTQNILNIDNNATKDIVILNMMGERLMAMRVVGKEGIDVSGLPSGVYWVRDIDSGRGEMFVKE